MFNSLGLGLTRRKRNKLVTILLGSTSANAILGFEPKLALNFKTDTYKTGGADTTFSSAITHAASTNATMTDGYGPEVVTNGKFGTDTAGWVSGPSAATSAAVSGEMQVTSVSSYGRVITAIPTVVGRQYEVSGVGRVISGAGVPAASLYLTNSTGSTIQAGTVNYTTTNAPLGLFFTATATTSYISAITFGNVGNVSAFDNVSVRQSPALKWRPHNLLRSSEDITNPSYYVKWDDKGDTSQTFTQITDSTNPLGASSVTKISPNFVTDPQGASRTVRIYQNAGSTSGGEIITLSVFVKPVTTTSTYPSDTAKDLILFLTCDNASQVMWVNLNTQAVSNSNVTYTSVGDGWYKATSRIIRNVHDDSSTNCFIYLNNRTNLASFDPYPQADLDVRITGFHAYKSSLGGMVNNPDASTGLESYVPTTTAAVYAPRRGHHIYNGDAWVNEGILHESVGRTNIATYSNDFGNWAYLKWLHSGTTVTPNSAISPDGTTNATKLDMASNGYIRKLTGHAPSVGQTYTFSVWIKAGTASEVKTAILFNGSGLGYEQVTHTLTNEWQRFIVTKTLTSGTPDQVRARFVATQAGTIFVYGAQIELGAIGTASSYIPTTSTTVTRAAETLRVPAANLPYPTPVETTGTELVPNGTFDTDLSGWEGYNDTPLWDNGRLYITAPTAFDGARTTLNNVPTTTGKRYKLTWDVELGTLSSVKVDVYGVLSAAGLQGSLTVSATGSYTLYFTAGHSAANIYLLSGNAVGSAWFDNVSIKEVSTNMSIQMDGKMTYADIGGDNGKFFSWHLGNSNNIYSMLSTYNARTGQIYWVQESGNVLDFVSGPDTSYSPDTNVPFNFASRHGSTFINAAIDGTALTADTTPTTLPDLSATNLELGQAFLGTIGQFRMWDEDITDAGITEAST